VVPNAGRLDALHTLGGGGDGDCEELKHVGEALRDSQSASSPFCSTPQDVVFGV
jgi:hypothetical protein